MTVWIIHSLILDENDMQEKVNVLVRLHEAMKAETEATENSIIFRTNPSSVWVIKKYKNKKLATCKSLCNLQEFYAAFKEKHPNINIGSSKFCA